MKPTSKHTTKRRKHMNKRKRRLWWAFLALVLFAPSLSLAAGGGGAPIVIVADTRKLDGIMAWWANMYNESHLQFAILTIIIIPVTGVIFGILADIIMGWIGIDLKSRELAEH
jgi:nitrate reductase NapE component